MNEIYPYKNEYFDERELKVVVMIMARVFFYYKMLCMGNMISRKFGLTAVSCKR